jgi:hypothetical protein
MSEEPKPEKRKWPRTWRRILTELAIVVAGVCLALAAQQAVDWLRWQGEVKAARQSLREEIAATNRFYAARIAYAPCAAKQEQEARAILDRLEDKAAPPAFSSFRHSLGMLISDSEWQTQRSSQVLTHFPRTELSLLNRYYAQFPKSLAWFEEEGALWSDLSVLQAPPAGLTGSDIARFRGLLDRTHRLDFLTILFAHRMLKVSDQLGIARPQLTPGAMERLCTTSDDKSEANYLKAETQP